MPACGDHWYNVADIWVWLDLDTILVSSAGMYKASYKLV